MHVSDTASSVGGVVNGYAGGLLADPSPSPAPKGSIDTIIGGIAPDWGPFSTLGSEARIMVEVVMAVAILACLAIAVWGAAKQRIGATAMRDTFSAEQGKGLIIAGLTGVFIIGSLGTLFTIVYGMSI
ncbi:hypothetical protein ABH930_003490 [Kitasatospora sp. GAS204A]|nr:hypothetical protein [Kitasatospora sp. GAS204B]